jgi:hypothetical protein
VRRILLIGVALSLIAGCAGQQAPRRDPLPDAESVIPEPQACSFLVGEGTGVNIDDVIAQSGAEGVLEIGDRLIGIDETDIKNADELRAVLGERSVGDSVQVTVVRGGDEVSAEVVLGANPDAPERPLLGVMVQTAFDHIAPDKLTDEPSGGPLSRAIAIGADMFVFNPVNGSWGALGVETPGEQWAAVAPFVLTLENPSTAESALVDAVSGDRLVFDIGGWQGYRILGSFGQNVVVASSRPIEGDEGFIEIALLLINFEARAAEWIWVADPQVGRPVLTHPSPDGLRLLVVNQGQEDQVLHHLVLSGEGQLHTQADDLSAADGMLALGWFDDQSVLLRQPTGELQQLSVGTGLVTPIEMPAALGTPQRVWPVGDGTRVLASAGSNLLQANLLSATEVRTLADHCLIDLVGDIGWAA